MTAGNQYRALTQAGRAMFGDDVFDREFTVDEEQDWLRSGVLEIVPRPYRVLSDNYQAGAPGDVFDGVYLSEIEAMLIAGGHIERVRRDAQPTVEPLVETADVEPAPTPPTPRRRTPKEK